MFSVVRRLRMTSILGVALVGNADAQTRAEQHVELRATLEQWMETVDKSQDLETQWEVERGVLRDSVTGLKGMLEQAAIEIAAVEERIATADEESQEKLKEQAEYTEAREVLRKGLDPVESEVEKIVPLFPAFYVGGEDGSTKLKGSIEKLAKHRREEPDAKEKIGLNSRIQPLVQILTEAERFHSKLWAVTHPLEVNGTDKQMNVIYFGLSVAYAVDEAGTVALEGRSSLPDGWTFTPLTGEGVAEKVRILFKAADGSGESQMVNLPLTLD